MAVREILKMGDARLLRVAQPVATFDTPGLHALIDDMFDTMAAADGAGLAAPQIGIGLQVVIFGVERNERYPDASPVPTTVLINRDHAAWCGRGGRLGGLPVGSACAASCADLTPPRFRCRGTADRSRVELPCAWSSTSTTT